MFVASWQLLIKQQGPNLGLCKYRLRIRLFGPANIWTYAIPYQMLNIMTPLTIPNNPIIGSNKLTPHFFEFQFLPWFLHQKSIKVFFCRCLWGKRNKHLSKGSVWNKKTEQTFISRAHSTQKTKFKSMTENCCCKARGQFFFPFLFVNFPKCLCSLQVNLTSLYSAGYSNICESQPNQIGSHW